MFSIASLATPALLAEAALEAIAWLLSLIASFATAALLSLIASFATAALLSLIASFATAALFASLAFPATDCKLSLTPSFATNALLAAEAPALTDCKLSLVASFATFVLFVALAWLAKAGSFEDSLFVSALILFSKLLFLASNLFSFELNSSTTFCKFSTRSSVGAIFKIAELLGPPIAWIFLSSSDPLNASCKFGSTFMSSNL